MPKQPKANANLSKQFAGLANKKHAWKIKEGLQGSGFFLDEKLSNREHKVLSNPSTNKVVSNRGTDIRDPSRVWKDPKSNVNILLGREKTDRRFKEANAQFKQAAKKYRGQAHTLDTVLVTSALATCHRKPEFQSWSRGTRTLPQAT